MSRGRTPRKSAEFARAFGDALCGWLHGRGLDQSDAARILGLGRSGEARISTYCHDSPQGKRSQPDLEFLCLACTRLDGFEFEYRGFRISAATLNGNGAKPTQEQPEQLPMDYEGQFDLTGGRGTIGTVSVSLKRPVGRVELSVELRAVS